MYYPLPGVLFSFIDNDTVTYTAKLSLIFGLPIITGASCFMADNLHPVCTDRVGYPLGRQTGMSYAFQPGFHARISKYF